VAFSAGSTRLISRDQAGKPLVWSVPSGRLLVDENPPAPATEQAQSPNGLYEAVPEGNDVRLICRYDPWAEDDARRRAWMPTWHAVDANAAERAGDWFAADFHLGRLIALKPHDALLRLRRARACRQLDRPFSAWVHTIVAAASDPKAMLPVPAPVKKDVALTPVKLTIHNRTGQTIRLFWLSGNRGVFYKALADGESYEQPTFAGHHWQAEVTGRINPVEFTVPDKDGTWQVQ
jgi:hypothetical protein